MLQRLQRRNIQRVAERVAQRHGAVEAPAVVLIVVQTAGRRLTQRRIVDDLHGRPAVVERQRVEKRLQRRAWLPRRAHGIDEALRPLFPAAARHNPGEHLARRVVHGEHRAVAHALRREKAEPLVEHALHLPLQPRVERRRHLRAPARTLRSREPFRASVLHEVRRRHGEMRRIERERFREQRIALGGRKLTAAHEHRRKPLDGAAACRCARPASA